VTGTPYAPIRYPSGARAQAVPRPTRVDVRDFLAVAGASDSSAQIQAALDSGATEVTLGNTGIYRAAVTVPAGVTLLSSGAKLRPLPSATATYVIMTGGAGATIQGVAFDGTADSNLIGGELFILIQHASARILRCQFAGNGYRYGVKVQASSGSCDDGEISDNVFTGTGAAIFKHDANTTGNRFRYNRNRFMNIARGDAIEINLGNDVGFEILDNVIDGVTGNGLPNAGIGIGIAGSGAYGGPESGQNRHFRVARNWIRNTEKACIHIEVCARGSVTDNTVIREDGVSTGRVGIEMYGSTRVKIARNAANGFQTGIRSEIGSSGGTYLVSSDKNRIEDNDVDDCSIGIYDGTARTRRSARVANNRITGCDTGLHLYGGADFTVVDNRISDCPLPMNLDLEPAAKGAVNSTSGTLLIERNIITVAGLPLAYGVAMPALTNTVIRERGNSFWLGSGPGNKYDYHQPGDIVADGTDQLVCLTPGWRQKNALGYFMTAIAGNNFVKVSGAAGDPIAGFAVGQVIVLPGMGPAGADMTATIRRIYIAAPDYRLEIDGIIGTTVSVATAINLLQTATYGLLAFGPGSDQWLKQVGGAFGFALLSPSATDAATGLPTASTVRWPDGTDGAFTGTINPTVGNYSGWVVTWAGSTTRTLTVTGVTYDANGNALGPTSLVVS